MKTAVKDVRGVKGAKPARVWLFDLDDTLHDAMHASMDGIRQAMGDYMTQHLGLAEAEAVALRTRYWHKYGATLLGVVRHHGVTAAHFLHHTHVLPGLEARVRGHGADLAALARLPGRKVIVTNAPAAYAMRVMGALGARGIAHLFDDIVTIEQMRMFGDLRPKPDARMFRNLAARLGVRPSQCTLVEDTLAHQKSARSVGMHTVWMQRYVRQAGARRHRRPAYVERRVRRLSELLRAG